MVRAVLHRQAAAAGRGRCRGSEPAQPVAIAVHPGPQHPVPKSTATAQGQGQWRVSCGCPVEPASQLVTNVIADLAKKDQRHVPLLRTRPPQVRRKRAQLCRRDPQALNNLPRRRHRNKQPHRPIVASLPIWRRQAAAIAG